MDEALTWEILSRLSSAKTSNREAAPDGGGLLPFFAQREEENEEEEKIADPTPSASDAADVPADCAPSFLTACPLRSSRHAIHNDGRGGSRSNVFPAIYSREAIENEFRHVLRLRDGRMTTSEMSMWLGIKEEDLELVGGWLCDRDAEKSSDDGRVCKVYNPTVQRHDYALVENLRASLRERINCYTEMSSGEYDPSLEAMVNGNSTTPYSFSKNIDWIPTGVSPTGMKKQIAQEMELTCEDAAWLMEEAVSVDELSKIEQSMQYYLEKEVLSSLVGVTVPTPLDGLFGQETAAASTVIFIVQSLCEKGMLHGVLSTPSSSTSEAAASLPTTTIIRNAIYTPHIYSHTQRQIADSFYETNGYLTGKKCVSLGLSRNRMEKFVKESFPNAVLLTNSIIDQNKICSPLENIVQDAILNQSFADLKSHLPDDIESDKEDVDDIINDHLVVLLQEQPRVDRAFAEGLTVVNADMVFFFSKDMVDRCEQLLVRIVEMWCKERAREMIHDDEQQRDKITNQGMVPLLDVVAGVGEKYPELLDLQHQHDSQLTYKNNEKRNLSWIIDEGNDATTDFEGPIVEFCRRALFSAELQRTCAHSLKAEVDRLDSTRRGVSVSSRSEGAAEIQHAGESFESSFRTLCHLIQIFAKSLDTLSSRAQQSRSRDAGIDHLTVEVMKRELLLGCGSCLARLITEYCIFQHAGEIDVEGEGSGLSYSQSHQETSKEETSEVDVLSSFQAINIAALNFPSFELGCGPDKNGKPQNPLMYLRSVFPGSAGLCLSKMWRLCSEENSVNSDDEAEKNKLESFLRHLSETCLTLVGIPFSILDKKTERKALAARREGILNRLENSQDKEEILTCAIVLIFQQVKNLPIAGKETINLVLTRLFGQDKKIARGVTEALLSLKSTDDCNKSPSLIARVKNFGSAKNGKALAAIVDVSD